ncbi:MAG: hypothetical protein SCALA702_03780 [Melioribacteraceae bacterium]|nr:MAG: hypothetical protein SCALA702_03780 [Melioribacteraceae bacterium]
MHYTKFTVEESTSPLNIDVYDDTLRSFDINAYFQNNGKIDVAVLTDTVLTPQQLPFSLEFLTGAEGWEPRPEELAAINMILNPKPVIIDSSEYFVVKRSTVIFNDRKYNKYELEEMPKTIYIDTIYKQIEINRFGQINYLR